MYTVLLPPGVKPIAGNKYIISYHIISHHIVSYHIISSYHIVSYHIISYHIIFSSTPSQHFIYHKNNLFFPRSAFVCFVLVMQKHRLFSYAVLTDFYQPGSLFTARYELNVEHKGIGS